MWSDFERKASKTRLPNEFKGNKRNRDNGMQVCGYI
jgi:hypothetical protein